MFVVVKSVSIADASEKRYEIDGVVYERCCQMSVGSASFTSALVFIFRSSVMQRLATSG
jgi:hypothetical protein